MTSKREENFFMPSTGSNPATGSTSTTDGSLTCKKRKLTSIVRNEFEKVIIDGQDYAICKHCKSKLKTDSKNGTKHLHVHLDRCIHGLKNREISPIFRRNIGYREAPKR